MTGHLPRILAVLSVGILIVFGSGCADQRQTAVNRLKSVENAALRRDSGRMNRDYFGAPGFQFIALKQSLWPKTFAQLKPLRVTLYRDGAAIAMGGDAGRDEWGIFVVPPGLDNGPPDTRMIRYSKLGDGVFYYVNSP